MSEKNLLFTQCVCIFVLWAGLRFEIQRKPVGIFHWLGCVCVGSYAGYGLTVHILLSKDPSVLSRIEWSLFQTVQSVTSIIAIFLVLYAGGVLILRIVALGLLFLLKHFYRR